MALNRDPYLVLGVPPISSAEEIKKSYRTLSKKYHPDLNPDLKSSSDEKMKEVVEAYNLLADADKRKEYNKQPHLQVKKVKKDPRRRTAIIETPDPSKAGDYDREPSILERIQSLFMKSKDGAGAQAAVKADPKQSDIQFTLGCSMTDNDKFLEQARSAFQSAFRFDSSCAEALFNMGVMCYKLGEFEDARMNIQKYLAMDKDDPQAKKFLGLLKEDI